MTDTRIAGLLDDALAFEQALRAAWAQETDVADKDGALNAIGRRVLRASLVTTHAQETGHAR